MLNVPPDVGRRFVFGRFLQGRRFVRVFLQRLTGRQAVQRVSHGPHQLRNAFARSGRDGVEFQSTRRAKFSQFFQPGAVRRGVQLCGDNNHRLLGKFFAERGEFAFDDLEVVHRIAVGSIARIDQMRDQPRAFNVLQKSNAQAHPGMRAFDQAGQVRNNERAPAALFRWFSRSAVRGNNSEAGLQRRERIIGNFRMRRGNSRNERGFSDVRKSHEANVRKQLQFKM